MPNWCHNSALFTHPDPIQLDRLIRAASHNMLFREFVPMTDDRSWEACKALWGVKWEADCEHHERMSDANTVLIKFDTAWCEPQRFYHTMESMGWQIQAWFWVLDGSGSCGRRWNGVTENCSAPFDICSTSDVDLALRLKDQLDMLENETTDLA